MRKTHSVAIVLVLTAQLGAQPAKDAIWTPMDSMKVKRISGVQISPDGKRVVFAVREALLEDGKSEYLTHIHIANTDGTGAEQLTKGAKSCDDPQWSPDGNWIAFGSTRAGKRNLWLLSPRGGEPIQLTSLGTAVTSFKWSPDSKLIAFTSTDGLTPDEEKAKKEKNDARVVDENIKMSRLYVVPVSGKGKQLTRRLTNGNFSVNATGRAGYDWSPDSELIVFSHTKTPHADDWPSADLSFVDVVSGIIAPLATTKAAEYAPFFSPDGKSIAYVASDDPPTWAGTARVHVIAASVGRKPRALADTFDAFGRFSEIIGWDAEGKNIYFTEINGTATQLGKLPLDGKPVIIPSSKTNVAAGGMHMNATRTHLGYSNESLNDPPEAYATDLQRI